MKLIFLLSLPRSGSTLAQRILAAHPAIATASEPWFLLPLVYTQRQQGIYTEYGHHLAVSALSDLMHALPNGETRYRDLLRQVTLDLYRGLAGSCPYFLDKTPRYHLIIEDLISLFPDARFILLWRNPLAIAASIIKTWSVGGRWNLYRYNVDLYKGLENLVEAARKHPTRFFTVRYEDMVTDPSRIWKHVFEYLDLDFEPSVLEDFKYVQMQGRMGDPTGVRRYSSISQESVGNWQESFREPLRRLWALSYLRWIGDDRLSFMGYDYQRLRKQVRASPLAFRKLPQDAWWFAWGSLHALLDLPGLRRRLGERSRRDRVYPLT